MLTKATAGALLALALAACASTSASDLGLTITSVRDLNREIATAHRVTIAAFTLFPNQATTRALVAARLRGARVVVILAPNAFGAARRANQRTASLLRSAGVVVQRARADTHLKAALTDGTTWLSDTNFSAAGYVIRDTIPGDATIVADAVAGRPASNDHLWTTKAGALAAEARVVMTRASRSLDVASESFGGGTALYRALLWRARIGDRVRLLVAAREERRSRRERRALARLTAAGVQVRLDSDDAKEAVDGADVWLGSANGTAALPGQIESGLALRSAAIAAAVRERFSQDWARSVAGV